MTGIRALAGRIAERVRPGTTVERVEPVGGGNRRRTAVVRCADAAPLVIQFADDPETARVEARLREAIEERTSVPVPAPVGSGTVDGDGWLAAPLVDGDDLHHSFAGLDPADRRRIARSFGRYLAELHDAFRFDAYGPLTVADGELVVERTADPTAAIAGGLRTGAISGGRGSDIESGGGVESDGDVGKGADAGRRVDLGNGRDRDAAAWLSAFGRAGLARLPSEFDAVRADAAAAFDGVEAEPAPVPRLFPWDLRPGNALLADGDVAAVLDWEGPLSAAPALSAAKTEYLVADWYVGSDEADPLREAFRAGYESVRTYPRVRPVHRIAAVASAAVDSRGAVTNPGYPPVSRADAVRFHLRTLKSLL